MNFFRIFFISGKSHSPKNVKEGPLGVFEHPFFCKIEKNEKGTLWRHKKIAKKVSQCRKKPAQEIFGHGRDSNPRPSLDRPQEA